MKRLCVIGNSHLAAVKLGWDRIQDPVTRAQFDLTFLGSPGLDMQHVVIEDGLIRGGTERLTRKFKSLGGIEEARIDDFDAFVLVGMSFGIQQCLRIYASHRTHTMRLGPSHALISEPAYSAAVSDRLRGTLSWRVAVDLLRHAGVRPVMICLQPCTAVGAVSNPGSREVNKLVAGATRNGDARALRRVFAAAIATLDMPGLMVVPQPDATVVDDILTRDEYTRESVKLNFRDRHDGNDYSHMNALYGELVLQDLFDRLRAEAAA